MTTRIVPFDSVMLPQAAQLLAARHQRNRAGMPLLPGRYCQPEPARQAIEAALQRQHGRGFAMLQGKRLVAYLIGDLQISETWGRSGWVRSSGVAYDAAFGTESVRELYAVLGECWVKVGVYHHFVLVPVADPALIHAWFSLGFGIEQVHALLDLDSVRPLNAALAQAIEIRKAEANDRQRVAALSDLIWRVQVESPVWGVMLPELVDEVAAGWGELLDAVNTTVWLAMAGEQALAMQAYHPLSPSAELLHVPDQCTHLTVAGTIPEARGEGIGTRLTRYALAQSRAAGYRFCETDWRSTNLLSSRFWPRQGFQPVVYRLARRVDQRIAWAKG